MVNCPRCNFAVDETTRTTCPLCFTPLNIEGAGETAVAPETPPTVPVAASVPEPPQAVAAAVDATPAIPVAPTAPPPPSEIPMPPQQAQPQVPVMPPPAMPQMPPMAPQQQQMPGMQQMQGGGMPQAQAMPQAPQYAPGSAPRPGVRVSLTGEVIEEAAPAAPPPSYVGGAVPPPRPVGQAPAGGKRPAAREEAPGTTQGNTLNAIILTVMFVAFIAIGGWYYLGSRTTPKQQAEKAVAAIKAQDWKTLYELSDNDETFKKQYPDAAAFDNDMKSKLNSNPATAPMVKDLFTNLKVTLGEPKIEGDTATIPSTITMNLLGREFTQSDNMQLIKRGSAWKLSGTSGAAGLSSGIVSGMMNPGGMGGRMGGMR